MPEDRSAGSHSSDLPARVAPAAAGSVTLAHIQAARARLAPYLPLTPLFSAGAIGKLCGGDVRLKAENLQRTGSFKARGALNAVVQLEPAVQARGVVTLSAGNHGQALAFAAGMAGVRCTVFMAEGAVPIKVAAIRGYGAEVEFSPTIHEAVARMERRRQETGAVFVSPFADPEIIAGQGVVGLELLEQWPDVEQIVVPVGGGGLLAGIAVAVKTQRPEVRIVGVEPEGACAVHQSLRTGEVVHLTSVRTVADGLAAPYAAALPMEIIRQWVDDVILVADDEIPSAMRLLLSRAKLLVEPAGAVGLAVLLTGKAGVAIGSRTALVLSGGNIDLDRLTAMI